MQMSTSLADFTTRLEAGPSGLHDARRAVEAVSIGKNDVLDLSQMSLSDEDLDALLPRLPPLGSHVTSLNLFLNDITTLPDGLGSALPNLKSLLVGANPLKSISDNAFDGLESVEVLDVGFSEELVDLPPSLGSCRSLKVLLAGNGRLSSLPCELFSCSNLEELHIYGNSLAEIPGAIGKLSKLQVLSAGRNQIRSLPQELSQCSALQALHIYENELTSLPAGIEKLSGLRVLNADNNLGLPPVPRDVRLRCSPQQIAAFYAKC